MSRLKFIFNLSSLFAIFFLPLQFHKKYLRFLYILFIINCASAPAYLSDRGMDARDMVDIGFQTAFLGIVFEIGPYVIAPAYSDFQGYGLSGGELHTYGKPLVGYFFFSQENSTITHSTQMEIISRLDYRKKEFCSRLFSDCNNAFFYKENISSYGRLGLRVGIFAGVRFSVNFLEIADFFTGLVGADFLNDDYYKHLRGGKKVYELKK